MKKIRKCTTEGCNRKVYWKENSEGKYVLMDYEIDIPHFGLCTKPPNAYTPNMPNRDKIPYREQIRNKTLLIYNKK